MRKHGDRRSYLTLALTRVAARPFRLSDNVLRGKHMRFCPKAPTTIGIIFTSYPDRVTQQIYCFVDESVLNSSNVTK